jgi:hypothetical protein
MSCNCLTLLRDNVIAEPISGCLSYTVSFPDSRASVLFTFAVFVPRFDRPLYTLVLLLLKPTAMCTFCSPHSLNKLTGRSFEEEKQQFKQNLPDLSGDVMIFSLCLFFSDYLSHSLSPDSLKQRRNRPPFKMKLGSISLTSFFPRIDW